MMTGGLGPGRTVRRSDAVVMVWDHVGESDDPSPDRIRSLPGVNVISPTWFHLDGDGGVTSRADEGYVRGAEARGMAVWPLVGNRFDPGLTRSVITCRRARSNLIAGLMELAGRYGFHGINVDFERVYPEDRDHLVELVGELTFRGRQCGVTVSVDLTPPDSGELARAYDVPALAAAADYVVLMAYDQHPASLPGPGPVAGLDWTEKVLGQTLGDVPPGKLILGIPLYTRLWTGIPPDDVTYRDLGMQAAWRLARKKGAEVVLDAGTGLRHARYIEEGRQCQLWLEGRESLRQRASLVRERSLAGLAAWRLGFECPKVWHVLAGEI